MKIYFQLLFTALFFTTLQSSGYAMADSLIIGNYDYFPEGFDLALSGKEWGIYNKKEKKLIANPLYDYIEYQEPYFLLRKDQKWGILDKKGNLIQGLKYDSISIEANKPIIHGLKKEGKWTLTDSAFVQYTNETFDDFIRGTMSYYAVKNNSTWRLLNIDTMKFESLTASNILTSPGGRLYEGLRCFWVENNNKWMRCDNLGNQKSTESYDEISFSTFSLHAIARQGGLWYAINLNTGGKLSSGFDSIFIIEPYPIYVGYKGNKKCLLDKLVECKISGFDLYDAKIALQYDSDILLLKRNNKWAVVHVSKMKKPLYRYLSVETETKISEIYGTKNMLKGFLQGNKMECIYIDKE